MLFLSSPALTATRTRSSKTANSARRPTSSFATRPSREPKWPLPTPTNPNPANPFPRPPPLTRPTAAMGRLWRRTWSWPPVPPSRMRNPRRPEVRATLRPRDPRTLEWRRTEARKWRHPRPFRCKWDRRRRRANRKRARPSRSRFPRSEESAASFNRGRGVKGGPRPLRAICCMCLYIMDVWTRARDGNDTRGLSVCVRRGEPGMDMSSCCGNRQTILFGTGVVDMSMFLPCIERAKICVSWESMDYHAALAVLAPVPVCRSALYNANQCISKPTRKRRNKGYVPCGTMSCSKPCLFIRCQSARLEIYVSTGGFLKRRRYSHGLRTGIL